MIALSDNAQRKGLSELWMLFATTSIRKNMPARMMRQVKYMANGNVNMVGSLEQVYKEIGCIDDEVCLGENNHQEFAPTSMPSAISNLIPFFKFNESPRNMYRCQMGGRQAIGTLATAIKHRIENKMSSHERGFGYGAIYKSETVDLGDFRIRDEPVLHHFGLGLDAPQSWREKLNKDGLLCISVTLHEGDPICSCIDDTAGNTSIKKYKGMEEGILDEVRLLGLGLGDSELRRIHITFCITRPSISSRRVTDRRVCVHKSGPQSTCRSRNPVFKPMSSSAQCHHHQLLRFPSRMTIGMLVESLAGKSRALHGMAQDATLFTFDETFTADDYFGDQLKAAGYNYHGNEPMYSGITGEKFKVDIYLEVANYGADEHGNQVWRNNIIH
ncbi:hypothetical protein EDD21DRAFT_421035 [Dissophora ornata]|nr:hypothetical protein EDD21DRAFT_421035 [Dissophora ornata]